MVETMHIVRIPPAEVKIDIPLVRSLLEEQHPDFADRVLSRLGEGWDNVMFRLGEEMIVRIPRRKVAAELLENEQKWLPSLASDLPLRAPIPLHCGVPSELFPWPWSIVPWIEGETAEQCILDREQPSIWASFLGALHLVPPSNAPRNPVRSISLQVCTEQVESRMRRAQLAISEWSSCLKALWQSALDVSPCRSERWLHGDLHARNIITRGSKLVGVIDWGDLCVGDPATDLASVWALFREKKSRQKFFHAYTASESLIARAKGWALHFALILLESGQADSPVHERMGQVLLQRLVEDEGVHSGSL